MSSDDPDSSQDRRNIRQRRAPAGPRRPAPRARAPQKLIVDVVDGRGGAARAPGLARWLARTVPAAVRGEVTIALVGDARMRRLNREYRALDRPTDVLSFPSADPLAPELLGDIVIATGVALRQARSHRHALTTELRVLALHGLLHLLGYDHASDQGEMAAIEQRWRKRGGLDAGLVERGHTR